MKLAVLVHPDRDFATRVAADLAVAAERAGLDLEEFRDDVPLDADVVVAVGGDGTVLQAVRRALQADLPVVGVNVGHIGYLAAADPGDVAALVEAIAKGSCAESTRMTLEAEWEGGTATAINDVVVEKVVSQHAVRVAMDVDGRHVTTYRADGVVVATATGSTAYAFSAGGPMLDPELDAIEVTPVAAHNLFAPTMVFSPGVTLRFSSAGDRPIRVNVDGREATVLDPGAALLVRRGNRRARFLVPWPRYFDQVVREKFGLDGA